MIGTCYLQITNEDGSAIKDTHCYLPMTKLENEAETTCTDGYYFPLRVTPNLNKSNGNQTASTYSSSDKLKDFIDVKVKVVSTQLTQNVTLLNLLSFPTDAKPDPDRYQSLLNYLDELLSVKDGQSAEIVKFLQAILDKLIDILLDLKQKQSEVNNKAFEIHNKQIQPRVFEILVAIFQIVENQNKFASFRTVIDAYLSKNFCITLAHRPLLRIVYDQVSNVYEKYSAQTSESNVFLALLVPGVNNKNNSQRQSGLVEDRDENCINTIKSIEYIFKFAFRSRELLSLYSRSNNPQSDGKGDSFDLDVAMIFQKLTDISNLTLRGGASLNSSNSFDGTSVCYSSGSEANLTKFQSFILKNLISLMPILIQSKRFSIQRIRFFIF